MSIHIAPLAATPPADWRAIYRTGAVLALVILAATVLDITLAMIPASGASTVPATAAAWLQQLSVAPWLGLRNLDLLNAVLALAGLPMYLAILGAHREVRPALALLALLVVVTGAVLFAGNNVALPMLDLARDRAAAAPGARAALESAASALLARGEHGSVGALPGFLVSEIGTLLTAIVMLQSRVFGRVAGWMGAVGATALAAYTVAITITPGSEALMKGLAAPAGLLMLAWYALVARTLWRLRD